MTYDDLLALSRSLEGKVLQTATGKPFRVGVYLDCPFFVPLSTGLGRSDGRRAAERFLDRYNETQSPRASDYRGLTHNASYFLAVLREGSLLP